MCKGRSHYTGSHMIRSRLVPDSSNYLVRCRAKTISRKNKRSL